MSPILMMKEGVLKKLKGVLNLRGGLEIFFLRMDLEFRGEL